MTEDNHVLLIDEQGRPAIVKVGDLPWFRIPHQVIAAKVIETGFVLRESDDPDFQWPKEAPMATPIKARTKYAAETFKDQAFVWTIGFAASNGFCVPRREVIESVYDCITDVNAIFGSGDWRVLSNDPMYPTTTEGQSNG